MGGFFEEKKLFFFKVKSRIEIYYQVNLYLNLRRFNLVVVVPFLILGHLSFVSTCISIVSWRPLWS